MARECFKYKKLVSVIIPSFNSGNTISKCIDSLLMQTYSNIEIVVVDDGSSDCTLEILDLYSKNNNTIKCLKNPKKGASSARNYGLDNCLGDYIVFVDSDDWVDSDCIETAMNFASQYNPDIVLWNLFVERLGETKKNIPLKDDIRFFSKKDVDYLFSLILTYSCENVGMTNISLAGPVCKMYSRKVIDQLRFPEHLDLGEDLVFNLNVFDRADRIIYFNKCLYHYVINSESLTNKTDLSYGLRKGKFINGLYSYFAQRENKMLKELNVAAYKNYLTVIEKSLFIFNDLKYSQRVSCIKKYLNALENKIDFSSQKGVLAFLAKHKLYFAIFLFGEISGRYKNRN